MALSGKRHRPGDRRAEVAADCSKRRGEETFRRLAAIAETNRGTGKKIPVSDLSEAAGVRPSTVYHWIRRSPDLAALVAGEKADNGFGILAQIRDDYAREMLKLETHINELEEKILHQSRREERLVAKIVRLDINLEED